ncbi:histidinol-phosphate aminotransferase [Crepidotus variabilis]|uniref:histidinol-phosphate transaminase n=1 Tax=Crepidotus variabilis TaxID=179855 RepID=A0A9P6JJ68_9AGAR|nr:histidinol-phosphate aminotransferase [Crepidotus variabilis]
MPIHGLKPRLQPVHPAHFDIEKVIRPNILALHPYRCARDDYKEGLLLDANENSFGHSITRGAESTNGNANPVDVDMPIELVSTLQLDLHRYPDPGHPDVKRRIASLRGLLSLLSSQEEEAEVLDHIVLGVGSDEIIDLLIRTCVQPGGAEKILITPPTYGMYQVGAQINDVGVVKVPLVLNGDKGEGGVDGRFSVPLDKIKEAVDVDPKIKMIFLCSPGNPTGTLVSLGTVVSLLEYEPFKGIIVVDEAYIDFVDDPQGQSAVSLIKKYANLCVMQTFSKSFGLAAIRLGVAFAQPPLIQVLSNTKAPYNVSSSTAHLALSALSPPSLAAMQKKLATIQLERKKLIEALNNHPNLKQLSVGAVIGGNDANFVLVPILQNDQSETEERQPDSNRAQVIYRTLAETRGVVVRYRGNEPGCQGCLRITVGTEDENQVVLDKLEEVLKTC